MSARKRIRNYVPTVQGGGGGGPSPGGTIQWGPYFGEGDGEMAASGTIDLSSLALRGDLISTPAVTMPALAVDYSGNIACGAGIDLAEIALSGDTGVSATVTMPALSATYTVLDATAAVTMPALALDGATGVSGALTGTAEGAPFYMSGSQRTSTATSTDTITISRPIGLKEDELMVAFVAAAIPLAVSISTVPSGWTAIQTPSAASGVTAAAYYKLAGSSEPSSYTWTWSGNANGLTGEIHRIRGVNTTTPLNASNFHRTLTADLDPDPETGGVTTTVNNCLVLACMAHDHGAVSQGHTPPANHVEETDIQAFNVVNTLGSTTSWRVYATAGATGDATIDCTQATGSGAVGIRIAIAPGPVELV